MTEDLKLPWERIAEANDVRFLVQEGAGKDIVGSA